MLHMNIHKPLLLVKDFHVDRNCNWSSKFVGSTESDHHECQQDMLKQIQPLMQGSNTDRASTKTTQKCNMQK